MQLLRDLIAATAEYKRQMKRRLPPRRFRRNATAQDYAKYYAIQADRDAADEAVIDAKFAIYGFIQNKLGLSC